MLDREIDEAVAAEWSERAEGWVTALRLAALSLRQRDGVDDLRVGIQGDSRYVQDYLLAEVLSHLPVARQACMLKTAILDRFCAPLVEAACLTGVEHEMLSQEVLEERIRNKEMFHFSRTMEAQLGGLTKAGFVSTGFYEDRRSEEDGNPIRHFMPSIYVARAVKA